jgi:hypothetical protein
LSKTVDSPIIALFEDRPKQGMVYQLNLSVYLDARVVFVSSLKELSGALAGPEGVHLAIVRADIKGRNIADQVADLLQPKGIPMISMGGKERIGVVAIEDGSVKPMLQAAAKIFGITARQMVDKSRPDIFEIAPEYLNMLFTAPCKIYNREGEGKKLLFNTGDIISREKVKRFVDIREPLVIDAFHRLRLANAVTEQNLNAARDLDAANVPSEKKMTILSSSLDMVAAQFKSAGMDAETVELANSSIKAISKIAESATSVGNLVKQLLAAEGGYRYAHSQLLTFLGFHVIKMMGWWGDDQRTIISQAAFYHDISLGSDAEARVRSVEGLKSSGIVDPQKVESILSHAQLSARELQIVPDINPEVVRVVLSHHGSPVGKGFSTDIAKFDNLSKAFYLAEEWADYLMALSEADQAPDNAARVQELKKIYKDEQSQQIIETFRYLDPEQFRNDFLEVPDYSLGGNDVETGFAEALVSGSASVEESAAAALKSSDEAISEIESIVNGGEQSPEEEKAFKADKAEKETKRTVKSVTDVRLDEERRVGKGEKDAPEGEQRFAKNKAEEASSKKIDGVTDVRKDEDVLVKGEKTAKDLIDRSITRIKADTPEEKRELKMKALAGSTDLMKAALSGAHAEVTTLLAASGNAPADIRKTDAEGRSAIHYAAMGGNVEVLKLLSEKGAQLNTIDSKRRSPLFLSALHKRNEAFDLLLAQGGKINQQAMGGMTIAMVGAFSGNLHVLKAAVEKGVRIDTKDHSGKTVIDYAKQSKNPEVLAYIESITKKAVPAASAAA